MIIKNGVVITPHEKKLTDITVENGIITEIAKSDRTDSNVIDATGLYVCPGFVDIHTHGGCGGDFMDAEDESFDAVLKFHSQSGTTSLLATTVTAPVDQVVSMLDVVRKYNAKEEPVCRVQGAHLEGPYLSLKNKGAQHEKYLRVPAKDDYSFILENSDIVKTVTIAPELEGAAKMVRDLTAKGIVVCGGHDDGDEDRTKPAIDAGLAHCTHLWCAMSTVAMHDGIRKIGLMEMGLLDSRLTVELIADNHHITPDMARLVYKMKGADKMCVVSDALRAGGMPIDGRLYSLGSKQDKTAMQFVVAQGVAKLPDHSRYAGSIQPVSQMVRNLVQDANIPLVDAVKMGTLTPARIAKLDKTVGSITEGKNADFCLLDHELNVVMTIVGGRVVYERKS